MSGKKPQQLLLEKTPFLRSLYKNEEIFAEKRINRAGLILSVFFALILILLKFLTRAPMGNRSFLSNLSGFLIFTAYNGIVFLLIRKNCCIRAIKYITIFMTVSIVTIILAGYSLENDFVHSVRTASTVLYCVAIMLSGFYLQPLLPLYASSMVCIQYLILILGAYHSGHPVFMSVETFRNNIITFDVIIANMTVYITLGMIMHLVVKRQHFIILQLNNSIRDLTETREDYKKSREEASFFAYYDFLTRLPNYRYFEEKAEAQLEKCKARKQFFSVMCLGLDTFKHINHLYGNEKGSRLIHDVGNRLKCSYREGDFVSRFMGDKFLIILTDIQSPYNLGLLISKTRDIFRTPFLIEGEEIRLSASAGICTYPADADAVQDMIRKAEFAMYKAKSEGKNSITLYDREMQEELDSRVRMEAELLKGMDNEEFYMVYQPKIDNMGRIRGIESLLRWESPVLGSVPPGHFIPIAEDSGLIDRLGDMVLGLVCRQIRAWEYKGMPPVRVSVNVSPRQFGQVDFIRKLKDHLSDAGIDPDWLDIELTETSIMANEKSLKEKLQLLRDMDITLSIDDFGKGYSSLSRLAYYPINTLKIDKSFIDGIPGSPKDNALALSIIELAGNLECDVVAEGVETEEQLVFLQNNGCQIYQGYYFYKPLPPAEIKALLIPAG